MRPAATATSPASASSSSPSTTPRRDSCRWKDTAGEPLLGATPASPSGYFPWPPPSGPTAPPARPPPGPLPPTTHHLRNRSSRRGGLPAADEPGVGGCHYP